MDGKIQKFVKPLNIALKMEEDGYDFYRNEASKSQSDIVKGVFDSLAREELRHIGIIRNHVESLSDAGKWPPIEDLIDSRRGLTEEVKTVFEEAAKKSGKVMKIDADAIHAYKRGVDLERKTYDYYKNLLDKSTTPDERGFYSFLTEQENWHYRILSETVEYLEHPLDWFAGEEKPMFEGF